MAVDGVVVGVLGGGGLLLQLAAFVPALALPKRAGPTPTRSGRPRFVAESAELRNDHLGILTWGVSPERDSYLLRRRQSWLRATGAVLLLLCGVSMLTRLAHLQAYGIELTAFGSVSLAMSCLPYLTARAAFLARRRATAAARVDEAITKLSESGCDVLPLPQLFELNRRQLDQYQELTKKQQTSAFVLTQVASVVAFLVLVAGVVVALSSHDGLDKIVAGGLTGLGSLLSAFLASTFFKAHRDANRQLNLYYLEPQRTGRLLAAERLITADPALAPEVRDRLVAALLSWEMPARRKAIGPGAAPGAAPAAEPVAAAPTAADTSTSSEDPPAKSDLDQAAGP